MNDLGVSMGTFEAICLIVSAFVPYLAIVFGIDLLPKWEFRGLAGFWSVSLTLAMVGIYVDGFWFIALVPNIPFVLFLLFVGLHSFRKRGATKSGPTEAEDPDPWRIPTESTEEPPEVSADILLCPAVLDYRAAVDTFTTGAFMDRCRELIADPPEGGEVLIRLDTTGGKVKDIETLRTHIQLLAARVRTRILVTGTCRSAGMSILTAVRREDRLCFEDSLLLVHRTSATNSKGENVSSSDLTAEVKYELRHHNDAIVRHLAGTGFTEERLRHIFDEGIDYSFYPTEAYRLGVIGGVIRSKVV